MWLPIQIYEVTMNITSMSQSIIKEWMISTMTYDWQIVYIFVMLLGKMAAIVWGLVQKPMKRLAFHYDDHKEIGLYIKWGIYTIIQCQTTCIWHAFNCLGWLFPLALYTKPPTIAAMLPNDIMKM